MERFAPAEVRAQFAEYVATRDPRLRDQLVATHAGLAQTLARRFVRPGQPLDDLTQIAFLGLLKAIDRFDPERRIQFSTYAVPTIVGELKRHLRDHSWGVRPPRRIHDLYLEGEAAAEELAQRLRRYPTIAELARDVGASEEDLLEAMEAARCRQLGSLDGPTGSSAMPRSAVIGEDPDLGAVDRHVTIERWLGRLPPDEAAVVRMRFERGMSQAEIANALGRSQMYVSRTLARSLERLRHLAGQEM